jgi:hypothetical protein
MTIKRIGYPELEVNLLLWQKLIANGVKNTTVRIIENIVIYTTDKQE